VYRVAAVLGEASNAWEGMLVLMGEAVWTGIGGIVTTCVLRNFLSALLHLLDQGDIFDFNDNER
jgi:hypothetical protein